MKKTSSTSLSCKNTSRSYSLQVKLGAFLCDTLIDNNKKKNERRINLSGNVNPCSSRRISKIRKEDLKQNVDDRNVLIE